MSQKSIAGKKAKKEKFEDIQKRDLEILKQRVHSLEEESDDDDEIEDDTSNANLFRDYAGSDIDVARVTQFLQSGGVDCLICIRRVKAKDKIWSCQHCYCMFHLLCIQQWANDSMCQKRIFYDNQPAGYYNNAGVFVAKKSVLIQWDCPQCRHKYESAEIPRAYECFCGRERDPPLQSFLIPHSCGEVCNKPLEPFCSHRCLLLCHPGPHPSCAQTINVSCQCQKSPVKSIRCSLNSWACDKKCLKLLPCMVHKCDGICHEACPTCKKTSIKKCACGAEQKEVPCIQETWSCRKKCQRKLLCGNHSCERVCHAGECGPCPYELDQQCYCGKQVLASKSCENSPSMESCGDTCLKNLTCGNEDHRCFLRCHKGSCGACTELINKKCRCGASEKLFSCSKELLCEAKCKRLKNCKKHACNRKCCVECLPCDRICSKFLSCGKHKCQALCHDGPCYPCREKQKIRVCRCASSTITVLCGTTKKSSSTKCKKLCTVSTKCHHDSFPHNCHLGDCSLCTQICGELLPCAHQCTSKCHDYARVVTRDKNFVAKLPGEIAEEKVEFKKLPHPPCKEKIPITCLGGHEIAMMECSEAKVLSCGRRCNRKLHCGNHSCSKLCHAVADASGEDQDDNCDECNEECSKSRPTGCTHKCKSSCHDSSCKRCQVQVRTKCYCGLTEVYFRCCDVYKRDSTENQSQELKRKFMSCGSRCIKNYTCGHQCLSTCHYGVCVDLGNCKKKVKLLCPCKSRKTDLPCDKVRAENLLVIECDENCQAKERKAAEEKTQEDLRKQELEAERNKRELEIFENKFRKKKYRERRTQSVEDNKSDKKYLIIGFLVITVVLSCLAYYMLSE